jgi:hypothetical protein
MSRRVTVSAGIFASLLAAMVTPFFLGDVVTWGHLIPQPDLAADYVVGSFWAVAIGLSILFWPVRSEDKVHLLYAWVLRCITTLGFMLLYENHYDLDAYLYFDAARRGGFSWTSLKFQGGTETMYSLAWLHGRFLPYYHAMKVTSSLLGLVAVYIFYRATVMYRRSEDKRVFYLLAAFPGILFWSSILGKDPIVLLGISIYVYGVVGWSRSGAWRHLTMAAAGIMIAAFIRVWLGLILFAPMALLFIRGGKYFATRIVLIGTACLALWFFSGQFLERFELEGLEDVVSSSQNMFRAENTGGAAVKANVLLGGWNDLAAFAPEAAFAALFRPFPWEANNLFALAEGLESVVLLILALRALIRVSWTDLRQPLVIWALSLVFVWAMMYGPISYANLGTAVRFRLQMMPIMLLLFLYLGRRPRFASE